MVHTFEQLIYILGILAPISVLFSITTGTIAAKMIAYTTSIVVTLLYTNNLTENNKLLSQFLPEKLSTAPALLLRAVLLTSRFAHNLPHCHYVGDMLH